MTVTAHGAVSHEGDDRRIVITRRITGAPRDVWRDMTESARMERWIGRYDGDPSRGRVTFFMTAEGEDVAGEDYEILTCDAPRRFEGRSHQDGASWHLSFELTADGESTAVRFEQRLGATDDAASIGPGWEYYLARLAAVRAGEDVSSVDWDEYYPALSTFYA